MTGRSTFVYVTYIRSTPEAVHAAITTPETARRYWGHENHSDWRPGSTWQHVRATDERPVELIGRVLENDPPHRLIVTWANASQQDDPDEFSRVTFDIEPQGDVVRLTVTHDDLKAGSSMERGVTRGWPHVLSSLKSFLETGQGLGL
jgi:uncharacterized protein YndB with AHSA1/START domain